MFESYGGILLESMKQGQSATSVPPLSGFSQKKIFLASSVSYLEASMVQAGGFARAAVNDRHSSVGPSRGLNRSYCHIGNQPITRWTWSI